MLSVFSKCKEANYKSFCKRQNCRQKRQISWQGLDTVLNRAVNIHMATLKETCKTKETTTIIIVIGRAIYEC